MNKVKYRVTLDLTRPGVQHTIYAKKDDVLSREVVFALRTKGEAYKISSGTSAYLYALADGAEIFSDCIISDSTIIAPLTTNILSAKDILLELRLTDGTGAVLTTPQVKVITETSLYSEDAITATNDYSALLSAITRAENARITNISANGNVITITYVDGQTVSVEVEIEDGFSPIISVENIEGGHKVIITDKTHTETFNVMDGKDSEGGAPADWNASEGEAGHVLNRTHYEVEDEGDLLPLTTFTLNYDDDNDGQFGFILASPFVAGAEYTVSWNGVEYKCVAAEFDMGDEAMIFLLGNYGPMLGGDDTGEPFIVAGPSGACEALCMPMDGAVTVALRISGIVHIVKELDPKFIKSVVDAFAEAIANSEGSISELSARLSNLDNSAIRIYQGSQYEGKILAVNSLGNLTLTDMPSGGATVEELETAMASIMGAMYADDMPAEGEPPSIRSIAEDVATKAIENFANANILGHVDANNNIDLTGNLAAGEYTIRYIYEDGTTAELCKFTVGNPVQTLTNLANPSDAAWYTNKRLNSSGVLTDVTEEQSGGDTLVMTNLFDISSATAIHVKGLDIMNKTAGGLDYGRVYLYDDTGAYVTYNQPSTGNADAYSSADYDDSVTLIDIAPIKSAYAYKLGEGRSFKYFSLGGILTGTAEDVIITADQQIV